MKKVSYEQYKKDYCKVCVYNGLCTEEQKQSCVQTDRNILNKLATMVYGRPTVVIGEVGEVC